MECGTLCDEEDRLDVETAGDETQNEEVGFDAACSFEQITPVPGEETRDGRPILRISKSGPVRGVVFTSMLLSAIVASFVLLAAALVHVELTSLAVFSLPAAIAAFVLVYLTRVPNASRAVVTMGDGALMLALRPFPWRKRYLSRRIVVRLDARVRFDEARNGATHEVVAILRTNERVVLLDGFDDPRTALHVVKRMRERW